MAADIRILVVDDSAFARRAVERMLAGLPEAEVVGTAADGRSALEQTRELRPDVVILDVMMPEMNGLEALRRIMDECPTSVLVMSTTAREETDVTVQALELGAVDVIDKTRAGTAMQLHKLAPDLQQKVLAAAGANVGAGAGTVADAAADDAASQRAATLQGTEIIAKDRTGPHELVAIGASTGGPRALFEVLPALPAALPAGVVVAQHMPPRFTETLAERLDRRCDLAVSEAADGDHIAPGRVLIAPGGRQIEVTRPAGEPRVRIFDAGEDELHHPSVDVLFDSVARVVGSTAVGVVLTGMGSDGAEGIESLRAAGAHTLVESAATAVIDGMPRAARDAAERVLPLDRVAEAIAELCGAESATEGEPR